MAKDRNIVEPINAPFDEVVDSIVQPAGGNTNKINGLGGKMALQPASPRQGVLDIGVQVQKNVNGIEMGVLDNGIPFLTQIGLSRISGAARSVIYDITQEWESRFNDEVLGKGRFAWLRQKLAERG